MKQPLTLYGPKFSTYVRSVLLCCEEKGIDYNLENITLRSKKLLNLNPFGRVPVMQDGNYVVYESAAICLYIDTQYQGPALSPTNTVNLVTMQQWISIANCYLDNIIVRNYLLEFAFPSGKDGASDNDKIKLALNIIPQYLATLDHYLANADYFSGSSPGIADYLIIPMLHYLRKAPKTEELFEQNPMVSQYIKKMLERKSCIKILR
jgi:glutathione S-transferase